MVEERTKQRDSNKKITYIFLNFFHVFDRTDRTVCILRALTVEQHEISRWKTGGDTRSEKNI